MKYLEFAPEIPLPLWLVLAVLAAGMLFWIAMRRRGRIPQGRWALIVTFWGAAIVLVLGVLLNPTWIERIPPPEGKPVLTILLDRSAGMATEDETDGSSGQKTSRWEKASTIARQVAEELDEIYDVRVRSFAQRSEPIEPGEILEPGKAPSSEAGKKQNAYRPTGSLTDIARSLEESIDDECPQGQAVLLLSDGCHNGMTGTAGLWESVEKIRAMNVPVYTKPFGTTTEVRDLTVSVDNPQELVLSGGQLLSGVTVRRRGSFTDRAMVRLLLDGKELANEELRFGTDDIARTVFPVKAEKSGLFRYEVTVDPKPGEITEANNRSSLLVRVVDEPVRVLLLEGKPYWDTKFLIRTLASDMSIDLTALIRLQDDRFVLRHITRTTGGSEEESPKDEKPETSEASAKKPEASTETAASTAAKTEETAENAADDVKPELARKDDWKFYPSAEAFFKESGGLSNYLVVVLGRDADTFLTEERVAELKRWVGQQEGALVCFRGPPASRIGERLAEMLPVRWTPGREAEYQVTLSKAGHSASWLTAIGETNSKTGDGEETSSADGEEKKKDTPGPSLRDSFADPFADLPSLRSSLSPEKPGPLAVVLAQRSGSSGDVVPVISWQPFGIGRVVVVEGAGMWRWAFLPKSKQKNNVHALLWRSLFRRLVSNVTLLPNQNAAILTDKLTFRPDEPVGATLLTRLVGTADRDRQLTVILSGPTLEKPRSLPPVPQGDTPGRFRVLVGRLAPGRYQLAVSGVSAGGDDVATSTWFEVRDDLRERLDVQAQPGLLKKMAVETGGKLLEEESPKRLSEELDSHLTRSRPERLARHTAWDRWWVLTLAMGCFAAAWTIRRRSGLV